MNEELKPAFDLSLLASSPPDEAEKGLIPQNGEHVRSALLKPVLASGGRVGVQLILDVAAALRKKGEWVEDAELLVAALRSHDGNEALIAELEHVLGATEDSELVSFAHQQLASHLARQGDTAGAEKHYRASLRSSPASMDALGGLLQLLLAEQRPGDALSTFDAWSGGRPDAPQQRAVRATIVAALEGTEAGIAVTDQALEEFPGDWMLITVLVHLLVQGGVLDRAIKVIDTALARQPGDRDMLLARAEVLLRSNDVGNAVPLARSLVAEFPTDVRAHLLLVRALAAGPQPFDAARALSTAIDLLPDEVLLREMTGAALQISKETAREHVADEDPRLAREALATALGFDDADADANAMLAEIERSEGDLDAALQHFRKAKLSEPGSGWIRGGLGQVLLAMGRVDEGMAELRTAAELDPSLEWVFVELADASRLRGDTRTALAWAERAIDVRPEDAWALTELGVTQAQLERWDEALTTLDHALDRLPQYGWALAVKARVLASIDRVDDALDTTELAIQADPTVAWVHGLKASLLGFAGADDDHILAAARRAVELDPKDARLQATMGDALLRAGRERDAANAFHDGIVAANGSALKSDVTADVAWCHLRLGEPDKALRLLTGAAAAEEVPTIPTRFDTALALLCLGRSAAAIDMYESTLDLAMREPHPGRSRNHIRVAQRRFRIIADAGSVKDSAAVKRVAVIVERAHEVGT